MSHGVDEIRRLRNRQIADGKTEAADQRYQFGELIHLACALLLHRAVTGEALIPGWCTGEADRLAAKCTPDEMIAHAGACLAAEIDRRSYNPHACQKCGANVAPAYRVDGPGGIYHTRCAPDQPPINYPKFEQSHMAPAGCDVDGWDEHFERDAARYRALRSHEHAAAYAYSGITRNAVACGPGVDYGPKLDAALDALAKPPEADS